jgi:hypothetical protein
MKDKPQARQDFLLKMYETAWQNITRTDESLWKFFISFSTVIVATLFLSDKVMKDPFTGLIISLVLTAIATCYSSNVNLWFLRNLVIIGNLEATFLQNDDYDKIIPKSWHPPYRGNFFNFSEFPTILGYVYPAFGILMVILYSKYLCQQQMCYIYILSLILFILVTLYVLYLAYRFNKLKKEAPGPDC